MRSLTPTEGQKGFIRITNNEVEYAYVKHSCREGISGSYLTYITPNTKLECKAVRMYKAWQKGKYMDSNINKLKKIINSKMGDDEYMDDKDILYKKIREVKGDPVFADLISENGYKTEQEESPVSWLMIDIAELMRVIDRHEAMGNHHYSEEIEDFAGFLIKIMEITA